MIHRSRTEYSAVNTTVAGAARIITILAGFAVRVVFTHTLNEYYVGINGLFTDILNVLSLSELGVGTAITCALYKPIAENDIEKQKTLMKIYRLFYRWVAVIVLAGGLLILPFLDEIIKEGTSIEYIVQIYLMYLANAVLSYLLVYKKTLIDAHQLNYITVLCYTVFLLLQYVLQIVFLLTTKNFFLYVSAMIFCTMAGNLWISHKADKMYPYLREKEVERLSKKEKDSIFSDIRAMLMHKIGTVMVNNTDNLLLSMLAGLLSVSRYSNYFLIIGSVRQVLNQIFQGIAASVGNLNVKEEKAQVRKIFEASFFAGQWMFGVSTICLYQLLDIFVDFCFGEKYVFKPEVTRILCINFYLTGMRQAVLIFRDSIGLFRYDKYKALVEALINLVVSYVLGQRFGAVGVFLGTAISTVTTSLWVEPYVLYKHHLKYPVRSYFIKYLYYASVTVLAGIVCSSLCRHITGAFIIMFPTRGIVCIFFVNVLYLMAYARMKEFRLLVDRGKKLINSLQIRK